jgi:NlpC/P60 family putative phage cell wall peptidase
MTTSDDIVKVARLWIGTPYQHQASLKDVGCDCLGLVRGVWRECCGEEPELTPPYVPDWAESGGVETLAEAAARHLKRVETNQFLAGDVLLFRWRPWLPAKHAGIATSPNSMVHAHDKCAVTEIVMSAWWRRHLAFVFRFPDVN